MVFTIFALTPSSPADSFANLHYYFPPARNSKPRTITVDVCVYGGTAGGVMAAIQSARLGRKVAMLENSDHIGGMTTGGLSWTDFGNKAAIGGIAREFYRKLGAHYGVPEEWNFEPHAAEEALEAMVREADVPVYRRQFLKSVRKQGPRILSITTEDGLTVEAGMFIDATYEGDLMAKAGVSFTVGREGNAVYGETINGVQIRGSHQFDRPVDPYVKPGDPESGLLPGVNPSVEPAGTGDKRIQAYNFRLCLTREPVNRIPFSKRDFIF